MAQKEKMHVTIDPWILKRLHEMARKNNRTLSSMVNVLLAEAVANNDKNVIKAKV